jgi:hypothetical protein
MRVLQQGDPALHKRSARLLEVCRAERGQEANRSENRAWCYAESTRFLEFRRTNNRNLSSNRAERRLPMPSDTEIEAARRALTFITRKQHPSQADALTLRLWSGPHTALRSIQDIALDLLDKVEPRFQAIKDG